MTPAAARSANMAARRTLDLRVRYGVVVLGVLVAFLGVGAKLVWLGLAGQAQAGAGRAIRLAVSETLVRSTQRPDIVDRNGRLIAADVPVPSVFADPHLILDVDEVVDRMAERFRDIDAADLRGQLADKSKRFVWIRRGISPKVAQSILDLGLAGVQLRTEMRRAYPHGRLASHLIGAVGTDNQGLAGVERAIDAIKAQGGQKLAADGAPAPVRLTIDLGIQHGLETELADAMQRHGASGVAGIMIDVTTGDILAAASLPAPDPGRPTELLDKARIDRLTVGTYELGSIFKTLTVAMALDQKFATLDSVYDVRIPMTFGGYTIRDLHPAGRPLSMREIFIQSSNVGAGMIASQAGPATMKAFVESLGLLEPLHWDLGRTANPILPPRWGKLETVTISYGHGLAVAPLQFAAAGAALVNGGTTIEPGVFADRPRSAAGTRVISAATSTQIAELMRRNVTAPKGTGRRAEVEGLDIGGKTGTAEMPGVGGYKQKSVISSFFATLPTAKPRYALLTMVFEPKASAETQGEITAGIIAAPLAARIITRAAPLLDVR